MSVVFDLDVGWHSHYIDSLSLHVHESTSFLLEVLKKGGKRLNYTKVVLVFRGLKNLLLSYPWF